MSKNIVILGAGASAQGGAPLMKDFLDAAELVTPGGGYLTVKEANHAAESFGLVFKALLALRAAYAKAKLDTRNIESVFAAFEMANLLGTLPDMQTEEIAKLPTAMAHVIQDTLETSVIFDFRDGQYFPPKPYHEFVQMLEEVKDSKPTIITFNYDVSLDYALFFNCVPIDYCLEESPKGNDLKLLKLHGSLNWFRCSHCNGKIVAQSVSDLTRGDASGCWQPKSSTQYNVQYNLRIGPCTKKFSHDGKVDVMEGPMIVPPTSNKLMHHRELQSVWAAAAKELSEAENILVFGYSLPVSDYFFRYLYALGSIGPSRPKRFYVFDPDPDGGVEKRFQDLLGPEAHDRFRKFKQPFNEAINDLKSQGLLS